MLFFKNKKKTQLESKMDWALSQIKYVEGIVESARLIIRGDYNSESLEEIVFVAVAPITNINMVLNDVNAALNIAKSVISNTNSQMAWKDKGTEALTKVINAKQSIPLAYTFMDQTTRMAIKLCVTPEAKESLKALKSATKQLIHGRMMGIRAQEEMAQKMMTAYKSMTLSDFAKDKIDAFEFLKKEGQELDAKTAELMQGAAKQWESAEKQAANVEVLLKRMRVENGEIKVFKTAWIVMKMVMFGAHAVDAVDNTITTVRLEVE